MQTVLTDEQIDDALKELNVAWSALPGQGLVRVFVTDSFSEGIALVGRIAQVAEKVGHHPDVHLTSDQVELTLVTHDAGGVTQKDLELAQEIDALGMVNMA